MDFLRDYQQAAVDKMFDGCILNGGVGSGKSRTGLYYYFEEYGGSFKNGVYVRMKNPAKLVIITTAKKRDTHEWEEELLQYSMSTKPDMSIYDNEIIVDSWNNIGKYENVTGAFFIFDEDKVTGKGAWVKSFYKIAKNNRWIILSATAGDTWEQYAPVFIANGFYRNITEFRNEHCVYSRYTNYPMIERYINVDRLNRLRNRILIEMDFHRNTIRKDIDIYCDYDKDLYKKVVKTRWDIYKDEPIQQASTLCYILRRVVNENEYRINALLDILETSDKLIIFYNFDYELVMLRNLFWQEDNNYGLEYEVAEWNGHMHQPLPTSERWVYLVQYTAGCEGWNCITTNKIVFFSQNHSYRVVEQARGRIDRMNTPFTELFYYHLKTRSTIDIDISKRLASKKRFNERKFAERYGFA